MSDLDLQKAHRYFAAEAFNRCWDLIRLPERSDEQTREMIRLAEASFWHWMEHKAHTVKNESVGRWQLARVYALAGISDIALTYAKQCLDCSQEGELGPFYIGYAYEALARAHAAAGDPAACRDSLERARSLLGQITDSESRGWLEADLDGISADPRGGRGSTTRRESPRN